MRKAVLTALIALSALAAGDNAAARPGPQPGGLFVKLNEITTPIFGESRVEGALSVTLIVQAADQKTADALKAQMPELRAVSLAATLEFARLYASGFLPVNAERLSADLNAALKRNHPGIVRVLIVKVGAVPA